MQTGTSWPAGRLGKPGRVHRDVLDQRTAETLQCGQREAAGGEQRVGLTPYDWLPQVTPIPLSAPARPGVDPTTVTARVRGRTAAAASRHDSPCLKNDPTGLPEERPRPA
ncbi:hypothetical protein [Streptomyces sp. R41]|uniref:Uncharacterized protein n=1 Tax=Streptomyces sp. R41 TaxID=3238632 RepID=A0AB39R7V3_9ACTN